MRQRRRPREGPGRLCEVLSVTIAGTVQKLVPPSRPNQPEQAKIALVRDRARVSGLRIEDALIDEHGDDVKLKKGGHV